MLKLVLFVALTLLAVILGLIFFLKVTLILLAVSSIILAVLFRKAPFVKSKGNAKIKSISNNQKNEKATDEDQLTA